MTSPRPNAGFQHPSRAGVSVRIALLFDDGLP